MPFSRTSPREVLKNSPRLFDFARRVTRTLGHRSPGYCPLKEFTRDLKEIAFLQIGSNDGIGGDPLREFIVGSANWHGVFVEPVPQMFAQLRRNYLICGATTFGSATPRFQSRPAHWRYGKSKMSVFQRCQRLRTG